MENNVPYIEIVPECSDVTGTDDSKEEADAKGRLTQGKRPTIREK